MLLHILTIIVSVNAMKHSAITLNAFRSLYNSKYIKFEVNGKIISIHLDLKKGSLNNIYENGIEPPFTIRLTHSVSKISKANFTYHHSEHNTISLSPVKHSFVDYLYNNKFISLKYFVLHKQYTNVSFGYDNEWSFIKHCQCKFTVYPDISNGYWDISITMINDVQRGKRYNVNKKGYIHTDDDYIMIDKDTFTWLKDDYFASYINNNTCYYVTFNSGHNKHEHVIECNYAIIRYLPNITLSINNNKNVMYVPYDNFECFVEGCFFNMIYDSNANSSEWKVGNSFLNRYYTLFNYDDYSITLYSGDSYECEYTYNNNNNGKLYVIGVTIITIVIAIGFEMFVKIKYL